MLISASVSLGILEKRIGVTASQFDKASVTTWFTCKFGNKYMSIENWSIARGATDPEIDFVMLSYLIIVQFYHQVAQLAYVA